MATKANQQIYRNDVRTANTNVVADTAILNTTVASARVSAYGPYPFNKIKLGGLLEAARLAYNIANPD